MKQHCYQNKKLYFTLVELLIIIAIVAILSSMLLPALRKSKETSKSIACMGIERNFGQAAAMYRNDFESFLPMSYEYVNAVGATKYMRWFGNTTFADYLGVRPPQVVSGSGTLPLNDGFWPKRFFCPNASLFTYQDIGGSKVLAENYYHFACQSYGMNVYGIEGNGDPCSRAPKNLLNPSGKIAFVDAIVWKIMRNDWHEAEYIRYLQHKEQNWLISATMYVRYPHHKKANAVFYDGHGETLGTDALCNPADSSIWDLSK